MAAARMAPITGQDLARELMKPENMAQLAQASHVIATRLVPLIEPHFRRVLPVLERLAEAFAPAVPVLLRAAQVVEQGYRALEAAPPSRGYEPLIASLDLDPIGARLLAYQVVRTGRERAERDRIQQQSIPTALRRLAKPGRRPRTIAEVAKKLVALPNTERHVHAVFSFIDRAEVGDAVLACLADAAAGTPEACQELARLARSVVGLVPTRRARPITVASAAHEVALALMEDSGRDVRYTYSVYAECFTDRVTQATEREFDLSGFDPRPAVRRLRRRKTTD